MTDRVDAPATTTSKLRPPASMAKRRKAPNEDSSASEFEPIPPSNKKPRRRRPLVAHKASSTSQTQVLETYGTPHSPSQHLISSPDLMKPPLLEWYSQVDTARGMPWRKPFDPSLDADARAQRAYEVRDQINICRWFGSHLAFCAIGLDFRDHATADPGRYCDSLLQPVDGEVSMLMVVAWTFP